MIRGESLGIAACAKVKAAAQISAENGAD